MSTGLDPTYFGSNFTVSGPNSAAIISTLNSLAQNSPLFSAAIRAIGTTPINFTDANLNENNTSGNTTLGQTVPDRNLFGAIDGYNISPDYSSGRVAGMILAA